MQPHNLYLCIGLMPDYFTLIKGRHHRIAFDPVVPSLVLLFAERSQNTGYAAATQRHPQPLFLSGSQQVLQALCLIRIGRADTVAVTEGRTIHLSFMGKHEAAHPESRGSDT